MSDKATHTRGPWDYSRDGDYWSVGPFEGKDNMEGNEADYRLVACAPDLLRAAEDYLATLRLLELAAPATALPDEPRRCKIEELTALISRARGG